VAKRRDSYHGGSTLIDGRNKDWFSPKRRKPRPEDSEPAIRRAVAMLTGVQGGEPPRLLKAADVQQAAKAKRFRRRNKPVPRPHGPASKS
jgi:hypothetical protein